MVAPQDPPMRPKTFLLRVYSVKQERGSPERPQPNEPTPQTWEVRADAEPGMDRASIFYQEVDPRNLPPAESLIRVTIDDQLTVVDPSPTAYVVGPEGFPTPIDANADSSPPTRETPIVDNGPLE